MKLLLAVCLALVAVATCEPSRPYSLYGPPKSYQPYGQRGSRPVPHQPFVGSVGSTRGRPVPQPQPVIGDGTQAGSSRLFLSFLDDNLRVRKSTWQQAHDECQSRYLQLVSLDTQQKDQEVSSLLAQHDITYIWTSGVRSYGNRFTWGRGGPAVGASGYVNWSNTGGDGKPQPDNREDPEDCLAVLNNVYDDGIVWHDISCGRKKQFICESR